MGVFKVTPEPDGEPIVMFPARVIGDKGVHEFVGAARALKNKGRQARFVIVGRTDPDNPTDVGKSTIRRWQREDLVEWWGFSEDMADTLSKALLVCMPSYREGLPRVLIEAAACGRAIVSTDVPGCREIVKDGENGILVPVRDGAATADAIDKLLRDANLRRQMASRSREIAESEYAMDKFIDDTFAIYEAVFPGTANSAVADGVAG
jgi:glycosyltransferase involved in cell wall biosynthesis